MEGLLAGETSLLSDRKSNDPPIAFGSNIPRRMFPIHTAPTRLGIEQGLRGEPHRGPGLHQPHPIKLFLQPLDVRPKSRAGWYFGCRTGSRSLPDPKFKTPGPPHYQKISMKHFYQDQRPFGAVCSRFPAPHYHTLAPGSGHYDHNIATNRTIDFHESFGGRKTLKETVKIKCTKGIPEQCVGCHSSPVGDYYEGDDILCPKCFNTIKNAKNPMRDKDIRGYHKVRDCSSIHKHEFLGFPPKIILREEKETKRLKHKEAYFRLYYTD